MNPSNNKLVYNPEEIDFGKLLSVLYISKKFIFIITSLFALISLLYSLNQPNVYTSETLLRSASSSNSGLASQYGGMAAIAGINISGNGNDEFEVALAMLKSKKLVSQLMIYETFLPDLIAAKNWDMANNTITYSTTLYDANTNKWVRKTSMPLKQIPSSQEAFPLFSNLVSVNHDKKNNLVTLKVSHISPFVAQQWAIWIVKEVNVLLANIKIQESQASIDYLNNQIKITPYAELRTMFYELIQESTKNIMLAKVNPEYALATIDPPLAPEIKSKPQRAFICIMGTIFGVILSIIYLLIRYFVFSKDTELNLLYWK
ncbi:Wzz/FepE/Etk N-terminal domain-containing protein [Gammaproteobacteria bacterium]|nr:Wzz/FepE/Etk N-terminal domain-containing protein [Gammaproteobacteria bacterium]